jgi:hypothetical protein
MIDDVITVFPSLVRDKCKHETVVNTVAQVYAAYKVVCRCPDTPAIEVLAGVRDWTLCKPGLSEISSYNRAL